MVSTLRAWDDLARIRIQDVYLDARSGRLLSGDRSQDMGYESGVFIPCSCSGDVDFDDDATCLGVGGMSITELREVLGLALTTTETITASRAVARIRELEAIVKRLPKDIRGTVIIPNEPGWKIQIQHADGHWMDKPELDADDITKPDDIDIGWLIAWGGINYGAEPLSQCLATRVDEDDSDDT